MNAADGLSPTAHAVSTIDPGSLELPPTHVVDVTAALRSDATADAPERP